MKKFLLVGLVLCAAMILFLSGQSGAEAFGLTYRLALPIAGVIYDTPDYDQILAVMNVMRFLGRVMAFTVFGGLFTALVFAWGSRLSPKVKIIISLAGIIVFGIFDETHKLFIDGRHCTFAEIIVNIVCGSVGSVFVMYVIDKRNKISG